jgi:hypothetical protein
LHFYFSSKSYSSKIYTPLEKVVVSVTLRITKLGLLFFDFSTIFNRFYKLQPFHPKRIESLCKQAPESLNSSQLYPRFLTLAPGGEGELAGGEVRHGVANKRGGLAIKLTLFRLVVV